jgi:hypothetical protein
LLTGNLIDPGYQGHLLFTVYNASNKPAFLQFEDKLCTVVFHQVENTAPRKLHDSSLIEGKFPGDFVKNIGQTDPASYARLQMEVGRIQELTTRLGRLESEYNDVRGPIRELTKLIGDVTRDLQEVKSISRENTENIKALTKASTDAKANMEGHQTKLVAHDVNIAWIKWGVMALLGALATYAIINAVLPLFK